MIISAASVVIGERIRQEHDKESLEELMTSLEALGQLQPIIVDESNKLLAGERRIRAVIALQKDGKCIKDMEPGMIWAEPYDSTAPNVILQIEFDENMKRKDFTYVEKARFIRRFHETMVAEAASAGAVWEDRFTAAALRLSPASISNYLRIEEAIKLDPAVAKATTVRSAVKRMKIAQEQKARRVAVQEQVPDTVKMAEDILKLGDAIELIKDIPDSSIDFINFDPPWGDDTGHKSNQNWDGFDDSTESSDRIINSILPHLYRVLKPNRMMVYWYRAWAYEDMVDRLEHCNCGDNCEQSKFFSDRFDFSYHKESFSLKFARTPCIWHKPDKVSDQNRFPEKQLISSYETFLIARKGDPIFHHQGMQDVFSFARVPVASLIHPTEKPIDLCSSLLRLCTIPGESVLDPTAGSAAMLHAALLGSRKPLGFEITESIRDRAITRLAEYLKTVKRL